MITFRYYGKDRDKHFMITPFNKKKIIDDLREQTKGRKEMGGIISFSDATGDTWRPGKRIKSLSLIHI